MLKKQGVVRDNPTYLGPTLTSSSSPSSSSSATSSSATGAAAAAEGKTSATKGDLFDDSEQQALLQRLLKSKNHEDLQAANRLIKSMVREVRPSNQV